MSSKTYIHKLFVGSSKESLEIANLVKETIQNSKEVKVKVEIWNQGRFDLGKSTLENLLRMADTYDFGIFIFAPDDEVVSREQTLTTTRDNVVFEHGLFLGRIGPRRSYILVDERVEKLMTDYKGIQVSYYDSSSPINLKESVEKGCVQIIKAIQRGLGASELSAFPSTSLAVEYYYGYIEGNLKALYSSEDVTVDNRLYKFKNIQMNILLPETLADVSPFQLKRRYRKLLRVDVPGYHAPSDRYPLYIHSTLRLESSELELIDIPEILYTSRYVTDMLMPDRALVDDDDKKRIETREILNFKNALMVLLEKNGVKEVKFHWMPEAENVFS